MDYEKNQILTVEITDMTSEGEGVGKKDGFPFFIKDTVIGDKAEIRVTRVKKNYAYGRLEKVLTPSPFRIDPKCAFHKQCGGCQIQSMSYEKQLEFKDARVRNNLIRIGGFAPEKIDNIMEPILGMEEPFYYRNKAQYPVGQNKEGEPVTGFYAGRTHSIVANTECHLGVKENKEILEIILAYMRENRVPAYDESTGKGLIRHVLIRKGFFSGEIMVCLVVNLKGAQRKLPAQQKLLDKLLTIPNMTSVSLNINTERTNVILGQEIRLIWGKATIKDTIHVCDADNNFERTGRGITYAISPVSFYQVNPVQTEKLYSLALSFAELTGQETVWDLYCGIGTISLFLAEKAKKVYGVEVIPQAVENARENAVSNGIFNAEFFVGKAEEVLPEKYKKDGIFADVIVVDPPRKGCDTACLDTILKMTPQRVVYVSCDSATLARDLKVLCGGGYEVERVRAVDMFPMTVGVETVCLLSKLNVEHHIEVEVNLDEMDLTAAESKATYEEIKDYVLKHSRLKVSNLYIAQIKQKCGIVERVNYNLPKPKNSKQPKCPPEKEKAIRDALEHFRMI